MKITKREKLIESMRIEIEKKVTRRYLPAKKREDFWELMRFLSYNGRRKWWEFWK